MDIIIPLLNAFWVGGLICVLCQILIDKTKLTPARILVMLVVSGVVLTAVGLYEPLVEFAGGGATVPLSGFGYTMAKGVQEAIAEDGLMGVLTGGATAAAAGISAAIVFGYLFSLISKPSEKK
ncbi:MAG: stage V sporulation protein AE [Clostridia bacterium]|nr:stage V sporulation protein AE [Clostridia bacterium]